MYEAQIEATEAILSEISTIDSDDPPAAEQLVDQMDIGDYLGPV